MHKVKKHIAFLLLIVFCFPLMYQEIHELEHAIDHTTHACEIHCDDQQDGIHIEQARENEDCPVCDYEFVTFHSRIISIFEILVNLDFEKIFSETSSLKLSTIQFYFSLRAPPSDM